MGHKEGRVRFNLFQLLKQLEMQNNRYYTATGVAVGAGLHFNTVHDMLHNRTRQVRFETLERILAWLRGEGLDVSLDDLIIEADE